MKSKFLGLFAMSILAFVFLMGFASAAVSFVSVTGDNQTIVQGNTATVNFQINETGNVSYSNLNWVGISSEGTWSLPTLSNIAANDLVSLSATLSGIPSSFLGTVIGSIELKNGTTSLDTLSVTIEVTSDEPAEVQACSTTGNPGDLRVKDIEFTNLGILHLKNTDPFYVEFGDDDEWFPLDYIEVEIEIENNGNEDVDDIEVEWGVYNIKSNEWVIELEDEKDFNLKDGKDEILTISFQLEDDLDVDLEDLTDGKDYRFYVTATGTVDNSTADPTCVSKFETAEVIIENDFVVLNDVQFPEIVQCGAEVQVSAEVWNIGDDDQDEVKVEIHNIELGLFRETLEIGDIDAFDDDAYSFNFQVPRDAEEKFYSLRFSVLDEDNDVYENDFDDDESEFTLPFKVEGGCVGEIAEVTISATLESEAKAGEDLVVRVIITNNGDELSTFTVNAAGYVPWANSVSIDQTTLVLNAGESRNILFTFDVSKDASGSQSFTIELVSDDNQVTTQPVSVTIEPRSGFRFTGNLISGENLPWVIGALNIILVIIIIIVAVRVAKR